MKQKLVLVPIMVRLQPEHAQNLADAAHAARLPLAVFARELLLNRMPKVAPPLVADLSAEALSLLKICHACVSNSTQLNTHASAAGEPLSRLSGPTGILFKFGSKAREIALRTSSGQLDLAETTDLLARLEGPARSLNDELARPLNEGKTPSLDTWKSVLTQMQSALLGESK